MSLNWTEDKRVYELVPFECMDGSCLMIHERTHDSKLGALSLDHKSVGEAIIDELNELSTKLYNEQCRTHISDKDFEKIENLFEKYCVNKR